MYLQCHGWTLLIHCTITGMCPTNENFPEYPTVNIVSRHIFIQSVLVIVMNTLLIKILIECTCQWANSPRLSLDEGLRSTKVTSSQAELSNTM